jgi:hypothetical protein
VHGTDKCRRHGHIAHVLRAGAVTSLCWLAASSSSQQPRLLVASADSKVVLLTPPAQPTCIRGSGSSSAAQHSEPLGLCPEDVHAVQLLAPAPLQALAAVSPGFTSATRSHSSSMHAASSVLQVLGAGSDGNLYWLDAPAASSSVHHAQSTTQQLPVAAKVPLPWAAAALAVSPSGRDVLLASEHGAVMLLPTSAADAVSFAAAASSEAASVCGSHAHGLSSVVAYAALAWGPDAAWAASAGADGSLLVYPGTGT